MEKVESVIMRRRKNYCLFIYTSYCAVDCDFVLLQNGVYQNLSTGEIIDQFIQLKKS